MRRKKPSQKKSRPLLSLSIIARDAGAYIHKPIESTRDMVDEVVVVDTGSTDDTKQKAQELGARVFDFPWVHDFGKARTFALKKCSGQFVLWMDADEAFREQDVEHVRPLLEGGEYQILFCKNFVDETYQVPEYELEGFGQGASVDKPRIFINHPAVSWLYRVHESLSFPGDFVKQVAYTDLTVLHQGQMTDEKSEYYQALLWLDKKENPTHPHANMYLATYAILRGDHQRGLDFLGAVDQGLLATWDGNVQSRFHYLYGQAHQGVGANATSQDVRDENYVKALGHYAETHTPMARLNAAVLHFQLGRWDTGRRILTESLELDPGHLLLQALHQVAHRFDGQQLEAKLQDFFLELSGQKDPLAALQAVMQSAAPVPDFSQPPVLEGPVVAPRQDSLVDRAVGKVNGKGLKVAQTLNINAIRERLHHGQKEG